MKNLLLIIALSLSLAAAGAFAQNKIYKTEDKDGNVVYTDQPPPQGSEPMDLPELSIVKSRSDQKKVRPLEINRRGKSEATQPSQVELLQAYNAIEISSPQDDETIWGTGNAIDISVDLKGPLLPGMTVQVIYDGRTLPGQKSNSIRLEAVDRGAHTVAAQVVDQSGQVYGQTDTITFHMRQHSVNFNRPNRAVQPGTG